MKNCSKIKQKLFKVCEKHIENRLLTIQKKLGSIEESRNNETKSSVGDKYETGRAMMQMEEEKANIQLSEALSVKLELQSVNLDADFEKAGFGSLVTTEVGTYFISIGIGKIILEGVVYYCISRNSPLGSHFRNKAIGDTFEFNGKKVEVKDVC